MKSEDQGEELLSSTILEGRLVIGGEKGGLRMWEVGVWDDNEETLVVGKGASADVLTAVPNGHTLATGMDDAIIRFVRMGAKRGKVVGEVRHDEIEGVLGLGFEIGGRMISGGGSLVKVWEASTSSPSEDDEGEAEDNATRATGSNGYGNVDDDSDEGGKESSEEEEKPRQKKRKKNKGKGKEGVQHIMAFRGMD